jgi:hypothetical protein
MSRSREAIDVNRTDAALTMVAAFFCAEHLQGVADGIEQSEPRLERQSLILSQGRKTGRLLLDL